MPTIAELLAAKSSPKPKPAPKPEKKSQGIKVGKKHTSPRHQAGVGLDETGSRSLGSTKGELLDITPVSATPLVEAWHQMRILFEEEVQVGYMHSPEPEDERLWLVLQHKSEKLSQHPLYLMPLEAEHLHNPNLKPF